MAYLALALVLFHLDWHLGQFFHVFLLFLWCDCRLLGLGQEVGKDAVEDGLIVVWFYAIIRGNLVPLDLGLHVGLGREDLERVLHLVKLEEFLDELKGVLPLRALGKFLHLDVFGIEGRCLTVMVGVLFCWSLPGSRWS